MNIVLNMPLIDWVTVSVHGQALYRLRRYANQRSGDRKPSKRKMGAGNWYEGFNGDGFFWGEREQDGTQWGIFMSEGEIAHYYAIEIWSMALGSEASCTRLDYQVTIEQPEWYDPYKFRESLEKYTGKDVGTTGRRPLGVTVELNSRTSSRYARIYEKVLFDGKKETGRLLRLEYEYKGDIARKLWEKPLKPAPVLRGEIEGLSVGKSTCASVVGLFMPFLGELTQTIKLARKESSTWNWIDSTVRASFNKVINQHDMFSRRKLREFLMEFIEVIDVIEVRGE